MRGHTRVRWQYEGEVAYKDEGAYEGEGGNTRVRGSTMYFYLTSTNVLNTDIQRVWSCDLI